MRILITGGSGFIGTHLVQQHVEMAHDVVNLDIHPPRNPEHGIYWKRVDLLDLPSLKEQIKAFEPDHVYHFAARTDLDGNHVDEYEANTRGLSNMLSAMDGLETIKRVMFASSRLVCRIGFQPLSFSDYCPTTPYGESKVIGEKRLREHDKTYTHLIVRPTSIWGPWFDIPYRNFFMAVARGLYIHPGSERIHKSFGYVGNTVHQLRALMDAPMDQVDGKTFYVGDYPAIDVLEMARHIQQASGARPVIRVPLAVLQVVAWLGDLAKRAGLQDPPLTSFRLDNLRTRMVHDLDPLERIVGELPFTMKEGIEETVAWMRRQGLIQTR